MNKYLLVSTTKKRFYLLKDLVKSFHHVIQQGYIPVIVTQKYGIQEKMILKRTIDKLPNGGHLFHYKGLLGMHGAKVEGLKAIRDINAGNDYVVASVDDDMQFTRYTDYKPIEDFLFSRPDIGLVSANWARSEAMLEKKTLKNEFKKQKIVYTGGGLLFNNEVAELIIQMPNKRYFCDNSAWSAEVFVNGYDNYRYLGSVSIHRIVSKDGRKELVRNEACEKYNEEILTYKPGKTNIKNNYLSPDDSALTQKALKLHHENKKKLVL